MTITERCIIDALNYFKLNSTEEARYLPVDKKKEIFNWLTKQYLKYKYFV